MQEIKKNYGLILKGGNITLSDFTFERPFALLGNNLLVKVIGGGMASGARRLCCGMLVAGGIAAEVVVCA